MRGQFGGLGHARGLAPSASWAFRVRGRRRPSVQAEHRSRPTGQEGHKRGGRRRAAPCPRTRVGRLGTDTSADRYGRLTRRRPTQRGARSRPERGRSPRNLALKKAPWGSSRGGPGASRGDCCPVPNPRDGYSTTTRNGMGNFQRPEGQRGPRAIVSSRHETRARHAHVLAGPILILAPAAAAPTTPAARDEAGLGANQPASAALGGHQGCRPRASLAIRVGERPRALAGGIWGVDLLSPSLDSLPALGKARGRDLEQARRRRGYENTPPAGRGDAGTARGWSHSLRNRPPHPYARRGARLVPLRDGGKVAVGERGAETPIDTSVPLARGRLRACVSE